MYDATHALSRAINETKQILYVIEMNGYNWSELIVRDRRRIHFSVLSFSRSIYYLQYTHIHKYVRVHRRNHAASVRNPDHLGLKRFCLKSYAKIFWSTILLQLMSIFNRFQAVDQNVIINKPRTTLFMPCFRKIYYYSLKNWCKLLFCPVN